jgi:hypothetical protein
MAKPAQIRKDHPGLVAQQRHQRFPDGMVEGEAVQKYYRYSLAVFFVI